MTHPATIEFEMPSGVATIEIEQAADIALLEIEGPQQPPEQIDIIVPDIPDTIEISVPATPEVIEVQTPGLQGPQGPAGGDNYTNLSPSVMAVGGIPEGTTFNDVSITQILDDMFYPELFGSLTPPSLSFSSTTSGLQEIGTVVSSLVFTATFSRGSIDPQYESESQYRSGPPNQYIYTGTGLVDSTTTSLSDSQTVIDYTVVSGAQSWTCQVAYDAGVQPKGSNGTDFDAPLDAGTTSPATMTITGVYPYYATTSDITTLTKQALTTHTESFWQTNMAAESSGNKQTAQFPDAFSAITGIQFYNTVSGQWEWLTGSKPGSLNLFDITVIQISGVNYNKYTHNGPLAGARQLRFYTT